MILNKSRLYLVDSSIYIYQGWQHQPDTLKNRHNQQNNAFIGFTDMVYQLLTTDSPEFLVFAFDQSRDKSFRKLLYPEYKSHRRSTPDALKPQFDWCRLWVEALGINCVSSKIYEADDLIGTMATLHRNESLSIVFLTADKDLAQIVRPDDLWWHYGSKSQLSYNRIKKKFGVKAELIADQLALAGDKTDNIPGIPFIGMRTAARLLNKFGSLKNTLQNLEQVKCMKFRHANQVAQSLISNQSILEISKKLTTIVCNIAEMHEISIVRNSPDLSTLWQLINEHNMDEQRQQRWLTLLEKQ